jgi:hypothetical protein
MNLSDDQLVTLMMWARLLDDDARQHYFDAVVA